MLVAVQSFGSIWTARGASGTGCAEFRSARRVLQHEWCFGGEQIAEPVVRLRLRSRWMSVRGFIRRSPDRLIHRVYESEGVTVWNGRNKLFLRQLTPDGTPPDVYLFRISPAETGWIDRAGAWKCDAAQVVSFSEGNGQQEALIVLPPFGWVHGTHGTFCAEPAAG